MKELNRDQLIKAIQDEQKVLFQHWSSDKWTEFLGNPQTANLQEYKFVLASDIEKELTKDCMLASEESLKEGWEDDKLVPGGVIEDAETHGFKQIAKEMIEKYKFKCVYDYRISYDVITLFGQKALSFLERQKVFKEIKKQLEEKHNNDWDRQIEQDVKAGRLDHLRKQALEQFKKGEVEPLVQPKKTYVKKASEIERRFEELENLPTLTEYALLRINELKNLVLKVIEER